MGQLVSMLAMCPGLLSIAVTKHHDGKQLVEEKVGLAYSSMSQSFTEGCQMT